MSAPGFSSELVAAVMAALEQRGAARKSGEIWFPCVTHEPDNHPSGRFHPEKLTWFCDVCQAGGGILDLAARLGVRIGETVGARTVVKKTIVATYDYTDESDVLLFQTVRFDPKDFKQRRPKAAGLTPGQRVGSAEDDWHWNMKGVRRVLFRLPALAQAPRDAVVFVVEGEKDVITLERLGNLATTNPGGARKWLSDYTEQLGPRWRVIIIPDNDDAGRKHAELVGNALHANGCDVCVLELPGLPETGDITDWVTAGGTADQLAQLVSEAAWRCISPASSSRLSAEPSVTEWSAPTPLTYSTVPPFPLDVLPPVLRHMVEEVAASVQVPADLPAALALAVLASIMARRAQVDMGAFTEPLNLWVAPVLRSGERKGPAFRAMLQPLAILEKEQQVAAEPAIKVGEQLRSAWEERCTYLRRKLARTEDPADRDTITGELESLAVSEPPVPVRPRLRCGNTTPEKLECMLAAQGGALLLASEEGGSLFEIAGGRYARDGGAQLDTFLMTYDGGRLDTDRVGRVGVTVESPALTIAITPQPRILERFQTQPEFHDRGLIARFLFQVPTSLVGTRMARDRRIDSAAAAAYDELVRSLSTLDRPQDASTAASVGLTREALAVWTAQQNALEAKLADGQPLALLQTWCNKHAGRVGRLAALLHFATHGPGGVSRLITAETMRAAWRLGDYFIAHAQAAHLLMGADARVVGAARVLKWIQEKRIATFQQRDAFEALKGTFGTVEELIPALTVLCDHGFVQRKETPRRHARGQNPSPTFVVHPDVVSGAFDSANSANSAIGVSIPRGPDDAQLDEGIGGPVHRQDIGTLAEVPL